MAAIVTRSNVPDVDNHSARVDLNREVTKVVVISTIRQTIMNMSTRVQTIVHQVRNSGTGFKLDLELN